MGWLLTNPEKPYIDSAKTDVMRTWRKFGFVPPSESKGIESTSDKPKQEKETKQ